MRFILLIFSCFLLSLTLYAQKPPVKVAVAGISHGHVGWILGRGDKGDVKLAGIYEKDTALIRSYAKRYKLPESMFYTNLETMLNTVKPEAVLAFGSIYSHLEAVEACAPKGIHVMVEKPLAASLSHALRMDSLARKYKIHLLTNYETSWYPSVTKTYELVHDSAYAGKIRKVVIHDGHQGPKEIGCSPEFLAWLTDPVLNGGGAIIDFGCYGANLMTWLMKGQAPVAVTAITRQYKPAVYPKVDDDATIILDYPDAQCVIQASWNWPFSRKDMEVYGDKGYIFAADANNMTLRNNQQQPAVNRKVTEKDVKVFTDPFAYLAAVLRGTEKVPSYGVYSPENNLMVVRILEAARTSARTGKKVVLQL